MSNNKKLDCTQGQQSQETQTEITKSTEKANKMTDKTKTAEKSTSTTVSLDPVPPPAPVLAPPAYTKTSPNDMYRKLLPAVLFLLTFVTVMTILLVYMDNVALGAQKFRLNMTQVQELTSIPQDSPALVKFVRQVHLKEDDARIPLQPIPTHQQPTIDRVFGKDYRGRFVEALSAGEREQTTLYLQSVRAWSGLVVRAAPGDHLRLRGLHACLSHQDHPREISYPVPEADGSDGGLFSSRVLCLPLYTVLAVGATGGTRGIQPPDVLVLGGADLPAFTHLPTNMPPIPIVDIKSTDPRARNASIQVLTAHNYTLDAQFEDSLLFVHNDKVNKP